MSGSNSPLLFKTFSIIVMLTCGARAADNIDRLLSSARSDQIALRFAKAEERYRGIITLIEQRGGESDPRLAEALNGAGVARYYRGDRTGAAALYSRALELFERRGAPSLAWAAALKNMATFERERRRLDDAERVCRRALAMAESVAGPQSGALESPLAELALIAQNRGDHAAAREFIERAIAARNQDPDHAVESAATLLGIRAEISAGEGDYATAEALYRQSVDECSRELGPENLHCTAALHGLSDVLKQRGAFAEARDTEERTLRIFVASYGPEHPRIVAALNTLGTLADLSGDYKSAQKTLEKALAMSEKTMGANHPDTAAVVMNLAGVYVHRRKFHRAEELFQRALQIDEVNHASPQKIAIDQNNLGVFYFVTGQLDLAEQTFRRSLAQHEQAFGPNHVGVASVLTNLASVYDRQNRDAEAAGLLSRAIRIWDQYPRISTPVRAGALDLYAKLMRKSNNYAEANRAEAEAMRVRVKSTLANPPAASALRP